MGSPPVWLWERTVGSRYETAHSLHGTAPWLVGMVLIDVELPSGVGLRSSYGAWNEFLGDAWGEGPPLDPSEDLIGVFNVTDPGEGDDIQVVVPHIERSWIARVTPVDVAFLRREYPEEFERYPGSYRDWGPRPV